MDKRKSTPPLIFAAGIALMIVGMVNDTTAIWIVGIVLLVIGMGTWRRSSAKNSKTDE